MRKQLLTPVLALLAFLTHAQTQRLVPGYIITLQNDTLRGTITNRGDLQNTRSVTFTAANGSKSVTYAPQDLKGFAIGDRQYESQEIKWSDQEGKYFARQVLGGYYSLYETMPQPSKPLYLLRKDDGSLVVLEEKNYFGLLKYHLSGCPAIRFDEKASRLYLYRAASLQRLIARYNQCVAPQAAQVTAKEKYGFHYGFLLGGGVQHYRNLDLVHGGNYGWNATPTGGFFMGATLSRVVEAEVQLLYNSSHGYINKGSYYTYGDNTYQFNVHYLSLPFIIRLFPANKFYVSPGFTMNAVLSQSGKEMLYGKEHPFIAYPSSFSFGFMGAVGTRFRLMNKTTLLEVRYSDGTVMRGVNREAKTTHIQLLLRMALGK